MSLVWSFLWLLVALFRSVGSGNETGRQAGSEVNGGVKCKGMKA